MKKLIMMAVLSEIVLGGAQWGLCCPISSCYEGEIIWKEDLAQFHEKQGKLYNAIEHGNFSSVKELISQNARDFCPQADKMILNMGIRSLKNEPCDSPSDRAIKLGYFDIANYIKEAEDKRTMEKFIGILKLDDIYSIGCYCSLYKDSQWFKNKLADLIEYTAKNLKPEVAQLLKLLALEAWDKQDTYNRAIELGYTEIAELIKKSEDKHSSYGPPTWYIRFQISSENINQEVTTPEQGPSND